MMMSVVSMLTILLVVIICFHGGRRRWLSICIHVVWSFMIELSPVDS